MVVLNRQNQAKPDFISPAQGMRLREDGQTFEINHLKKCDANTEISARLSCSYTNERRTKAKMRGR